MRVLWPHLYAKAHNTAETGSKHSLSNYICVTIKSDMYKYSYRQNNKEITPRATTCYDIEIW